MVRKVVVSLSLIVLASCGLVLQDLNQPPPTSGPVIESSAESGTPGVEYTSISPQQASEAVVEASAHAQTTVPETAPTPVVTSAASGLPAAPVSAELQSRLDSLCTEIGNKLGSISIEDCLSQQLQFAQGQSVNQRALVKKDFIPNDAGAQIPRILVIGGIHGDEYSSISIMFKWMQIRSSQNDSDFHWRFLPLMNPDGLLDGTAVRQNANGVDLNRNFPTADWQNSAMAAWKDTTGSNPRRFPGHGPATEPETQWLIRQIQEFNPAVIISVHAPHGLLDFDGPSEAPRKIGQLQLHRLGVYPGSLGNYGGVDLGIPVITLELPSAGILPGSRDIQNMWADLNKWLLNNASSLTAVDLAREKIVNR